MVSTLYGVATHGTQYRAKPDGYLEGRWGVFNWNSARFYRSDGWMNAVHCP